MSRLLLTRPELEALARTTRTPLPWGPAAPATDPPDDPPRELREALDVFASPTASAQVDVAVEGARLRSWQHWRDGRVTTLATTGCVVELGWLPASGWRAELARTVTVPPPRVVREPPAARVELPHDVLLACGTSSRDDVLGELAARHPGRVDQRQLTLVRTGALGRMRAVVSGRRRDGRGAVGWVSWMLYADGWRSLTAVASGGEPTVRLEPAAPDDLGVRVARLVREVTA